MRSWLIEFVRAFGSVSGRHRRRHRARGCLFSPGRASAARCREGEERPLVVTVEREPEPRRWLLAVPLAVGRRRPAAGPALVGLLHCRLISIPVPCHRGCKHTCGLGQRHDHLERCTALALLDRTKSRRIPVITIIAARMGAYFFVAELIAVRALGFSDAFIFGTFLPAFERLAATRCLPLPSLRFAASTTASFALRAAWCLRLLRPDCMECSAGLDRACQRFHEAMSILSGNS